MRIKNYIGLIVSIFVGLLVIWGGIYVKAICLADDQGLDKELKRTDPYVGRRFHERTKMIWGQVSKTASILTQKPPAHPYKKYHEAEKIKLPEPVFKGKAVETTLKEALPNGNFTGEAVSLDELSHILFSAYGKIKEQEKYDTRTVTVPLPQTHSFVFMHPVEIYVLASRVSGLKKGLYHYSFLDHSLESINSQVQTMPNCCFKQPVLDNYAASIILTAIPARLTWRFDTRSWRYIYMVAGAVSQNIYLQCASLGLGSTATASFHDDLYNDLLGLDTNKEVTLLLHLVGHIKE